MRILLAEDDAGIAQHVNSNLSRDGYQVDVLSSGPEVWEKGETGDYAAIILHLGLPGIDGLSVLKRWRSAGLETPSSFSPLSAPGWSALTDLTQGRMTICRSPFAAKNC